MSETTCLCRRDKLFVLGTTSLYHGDNFLVPLVHLRQLRQFGICQARAHPKEDADLRRDLLRDEPALAGSWPLEPAVLARGPVLAEPDGCLRASGAALEGEPTKGRNLVGWASQSLW